MTNNRERTNRLHPRAAFFWWLLALLAMVPGFRAAAADNLFPIADQYEAFAQDRPSTETTVLAPFYLRRQTETTRSWGVRPFFHSFNDESTGEKDRIALWPIYTYKYRPERMGSTDYSMVRVAPFAWLRTQEIEGATDSDQFLFPFIFTGNDERSGRYLILFPFFWIAEQADLAVPLFPPRPQTFTAFWPFFGDFKNYWNRDHIRFIMWPFYVMSTDGEKGTDDFNKAQSILWPFFTRFSGPKVSGWRAFPLFAQVEKENEFKRGYFLWPFGHFRYGRIGEDRAEEQRLFFFLPFYGYMERENLSFDLLFPFYGKLRMKGREVDGYALGLYNEERNFRAGTRTQSLGWFLGKRQTALEPGEYPSDLKPKKDPVTGGGLWPVYTRYHNERQDRRTYLWPIGAYRWNQYHDYAFERYYVLPFYARKEWHHEDGSEELVHYFFPFFRHVDRKEGNTLSNALHLFFYTQAEPVDRLYAPLWTFWRHERNPETGAERLNWFGNAYVREERPNGAVRKELNLLLYTHRYEKHPGEEAETENELLFGLVKF